MKKVIDGDAIVYAEGAFNTTYGKTAHGLVRRTTRYNVLSVVDSNYAGQDAGKVLDGKETGIPIFSDITEAFYNATSKGDFPKYMVIGLAPDGGRLDNRVRTDIKKAIMYRLNIDSGLHDFLSDIPEIRELAIQYKVNLRDVRKTPSRDMLHIFEGKIETVSCLKLAVLGTDSAIGKRTTARLLDDALNQAGIKSVMIGTGQTSWLQGNKYGLVLDSLINDFVAGEIEHAVYEAWKNEKPSIIIIEGQGSLMNPAYPGGFEILAAGRPDYIILQHAPKRVEYDGFPGYPLHSLEKQIHALETICSKKVIAVTVNHENMLPDEILPACKKITEETGLPATDVLFEGPEKLIKILKKHIKP